MDGCHGENLKVMDVEMINGKMSNITIPTVHTYK